MSTLAQLLTATYDETLNSTSPAAAVTTRLTRYLNDGVRFILSEPAFARAIDSDGMLTFASVASTARYAFTDVVAYPKSVRDTTNRITLQAMNLSEYRRIEPNPATVTGTPTHYVPIGRQAVARQPADTSTIFVKSTNAGDTTQTVFIEAVFSPGAVPDGFRSTNSVTLTGTTAVALGTSVAEIEDLYLSAACAGTVTFTEDSGVGTELARIPPTGAIRPRYYAFYLWPTPAAAITYNFDYRREVTEMSNSTDEPALPLDFHQMLVDYAVMREFELKGDAERVLIAKNRFDKRMTRLKYQTQWVADELPTLAWGRRVGHSRLGGFYPADTWTRW